MSGKYINVSIVVLLVVSLFGGGCGDTQETKEETATSDYPIVPQPFDAVTLDDSFWVPRIQANRQTTIPYALMMCEETGRIDNLRKAAGQMEGDYIGKRFNDSDVFKAMEGIAYSLKIHPDPELEARMDEMIAIIAEAQEEDGYLYSARTVDPENPAPGAGRERWIHLAGSHELYNVGHMYEAAVAWYRATGKRNFLNIARKNADLLLETFGPEKRRDRPGHQEIEIGLPKLYRVTGDERYLELARFFLDQRGRERTGEPYPEDTIFAIYNDPEHVQDHIPVLEQTSATGHAVRAAYMYAGMADVAALTGEDAFVETIKTIWKDVVGSKLYITGGIGSVHEGEAFGEPYYLPNDTAYAETCAAVGNVFWNQRMFLLTGHGKYIDVLERALYNGLISGVNFQGNRFFYVNPLESAGGVERQEWFEVSCCPTNIMRFLPSLPGYIYARRGDTAFVNLYIQSETELELTRGRVALRQMNNYPWNGEITVRVEPQEQQKFTLALRIPGWSLGQPVPTDLYTYAYPGGKFTVLINGESVIPKVKKGYALLTRRWQPGDVVVLELPMHVRRVSAHENVVADRGKVALERGPLVYCLESIDNGGELQGLELPVNTAVAVERQPELMGGVVMIQASGFRSDTPAVLTFVPYYAWAHRGAGQMKVWVPVKK